MAETRDGPSVDVYRFAPAAPEEEYVYGASCPGWHSTVDQDDAMADWIDFMRERDVSRVCCLLPGEQLERTDATKGEYSAAFGPEKVRHVPIADQRLAEPATLEYDIFPFLRDAVATQERVVVHCLTGKGRTGHVLAAWLVHGRNYDPVDAIETVEEMGRSPAEAVESGSARRGELYELLDRYA